MKQVCLTLGVVGFLGLLSLLKGAEAQAQSLETIVRDRDRFIAVSGHQCGSALSAATKTVTLSSQWNPPEFVNRSTVYLSGWQARYLSEDHHVHQLSTNIRNIEKDNGQLRWQFSGVLEDDDGDDAYEVCYKFIALGWNNNWIDAIADDTDGNSQLGINFLGELVNNSFIGKAGASILPRGQSVGLPFETRVLPTSCFECPVDRHVLQYAYSRQQPIKEVDSNTLRWDSELIFKDDHNRSDVGFYETVSALVGNDVTVESTDWVPTPIDDGSIFSRCVGAPRGVQTERVTVESLSFDYALPVLSGWDLQYHCEDEHITQIGVWISNISYDRSSGRLSYDISSVLRDRDSSPGFLFTPKVDILGLDVGGPYLLTPNPSTTSPGTTSPDTSPGPIEVTPNPTVPISP